MTKSIRTFVDEQFAKDKKTPETPKGERVCILSRMSDLTRTTIQSAVNSMLRGDFTELDSDIRDKVTVYIDKGYKSKDNRLRVVLSGKFISDALYDHFGEKNSKQSYDILSTVLSGVVMDMNKQSLDYHYQLCVTDYDDLWKGFLGVANRCMFVITVRDASLRDKLCTHGTIEAFRHFYWDYRYGVSDLFENK